MLMLSALGATICLTLTVASLLVVGGVVFALFLFFPLFVLALAGVLTGLEDTTVQQHDPSMSPRAWRNRS